MGKRTKKDVEDAFERGFREGFHAGFEESESHMNQFQIYIRSLWRKRQLRKLKEAYIRKVLEGGGGTDGPRIKTD